MQEFANSPSLRNGIFDLLSSVKLATDANVKLLDYTIQLFKNNGLFSDYYGYHNVDHELEVTYVTLLSGIHALEDNYISRNDLNYLYASALLHDFDPDKSIDKPHEKNVIQFISKDQTIQKLLADADLDQNLICSIISRTVYPWTGDVITKTEKFIQNYFSNSEIKDNKERQKHFRDLGHFLSISDRIGGYALGDFQKALNLIPTNASVYSEIAVTQFHLKRLMASLTNMNKAQELEPRNPYRYSSRAYIKDAIGDLEGAIDDYKKCIELDPQDAVAHNNLGMLEEKLGRKQKADNHFKKADEISKDEKSPFFGKFNADGEQIMNQQEAQKEVHNVVKKAIEKEEVEKNNEQELKIQDTEEDKKSIGKVMLSVFKSKQEFKAFIQFIKNGFKH